MDRSDPGSPQQQPEPRRLLNLRHIITAAFTLSWANRVALMLATSLPLLFVVATVLGWHVTSFGDSEAVARIAWAAFALSFAWLAITVHRLVLASGWEPRPLLAELNIRRFVFFAGALVFLWALFVAVKLILMGMLLNLVYPPRYVPAGEIAPVRRMDPFGFTSIDIVASFLTYWLIGRISLILPTIAIDRKPDAIDIWRMSRGNAWKIAIVVGALPWVLNLVIDALWREDATTFEVASLGILTGVFGIISIVALSLTYFELTHASAPPPTHPPA
jgi:hypothetical protein